MQRWVSRLLFAFLLLLGVARFAQVSHAQGHSQVRQERFYGATRTEWFNRYMKWYFTGGRDKIGRVQLLPIPSGTLVSGSGTPEDPGLYVGHLDIELKRETPFVFPVTFFFGELYKPGTPIPFNPDPYLPGNIWDPTYIRISIDGKSVIDSANEDKYRYFVPTQSYDPPLFYSKPTDYGSIAAVFAEGFFHLQEPLCKGTHTMTLESQIILPGNGFYPNVPDGFGFRYQNSWTITVK